MVCAIELIRRIAAHPRMPGRQIKGTRDWFAHQYPDMDAAVVWAAAKED